MSERVGDMVASLSLEAKAAQLVCIARAPEAAWLLDDGVLDLEELERRHPDGFGQLGNDAPANVWIPTPVQGVDGATTVTVGGDLSLINNGPSPTYAVVPGAPSIHIFTPACVVNQASVWRDEGIPFTTPALCCVHSTDQDSAVVCLETALIHLYGARSWLA